MVEAVGYLGSALVVVSLLMTRILRLRVIGLMGSATFLAYGLLIGSVPIVITNVVIAIINTTFLWRATRVKEWFSLLEVRPDSQYLKEFLRFYHDDILVYQPDWNGDIGDDYRMGRFLYGSNAAFFVDRGIATITASARTEQYIRYLEKMRFTESGNGRYERSLVPQTTTY